MGRMSASLSDLEPDDLARRFAAWGFKPFHAVRVLRSHYAAGDPRFPAPAGLPAGLLARIGAELGPAPVEVAARQVAGDGTTKLLLRLRDGRTVESVLMPDLRPDRAAGCISSQVGCAMGCDFCATARVGFERNLTAGEIVGQFLALRREAWASGRRLHTVVFMGMGEPMLNLDAVRTAIRRLADNALGGIGWRQITVSTVGIVPGIDGLAATGWGVQLAVSLHAPDDATRARLVPAGRRFPIADILGAADRFQARRGRPVIIQYCLLAGINDAPEQAHQLAGLLGGRRMHVNLLRFNPGDPAIPGGGYRASGEAVAAEFADVLRRRGVVAHFRRSRGRDISAACGQLHRAAAVAGLGG